VLSEENRVLTARVPTESSCAGKGNEGSIGSGLVNKSVDSDCDQINLKARNDEQENRKGLLSSKRIGRVPQKREIIFYGRLATLVCQ
jgi:hypothetical protein